MQTIAEAEEQTEGEGIKLIFPGYKIKNKNK